MKFSLTKVTSGRIALGGAILLTVVFWLLQLRQLIISDAANYALLSESIWTTGSYKLEGVPYAKHLPLHPLLSYPLIAAFGYSVGMKLSSLLAACGVLVLTYAVLKTAWSEHIAAAGVLLTAVHHNFVFMSANGYSDLLFTAWFLLFVFCFLQAETRPKRYVLAGVAMGLACLTRYNGLPLFGVYFAHAFFFRRLALRSRYFWAGLFCGAALFGLWLLRNTVAFGSPLATRYTGELNPDYFEQLKINAIFYLNPLHNLLPILLVFSCYGIWKDARRQMVLLTSLCAVLLLTSIWTTLSMRFAFPAFPLLIGFACFGIADFFARVPVAMRRPVRLLTVFGILVLHGSAVCLYSLGGCNAWFDAAFGYLPKDMHLSQEGQYATEEARDYLRKVLHPGDTVYVDNSAHAVVYVDAFGEGVSVTNDVSICPVYAIVTSAQKDDERDQTLFITEVEPRRHVVKRACP